MSKSDRPVSFADEAPIPFRLRVDTAQRRAPRVHRSRRRATVLDRAAGLREVRRAPEGRRMNWLRLEKALAAWSAWYRPHLGRVMEGRRDLTPEEIATRVVVIEFHAEEQTLYEALDYKTENFRFTERVDALERLAIVAAVAAKGRTGGYWTEMHEILKELGSKN